MVSHLFPRRLQVEAYWAEGAFMSFSVREMLTTACATNLHSGVQNLIAFLEESFTGATRDRLISRLICEDFIFAISEKLCFTRSFPLDSLTKFAYLLFLLANLRIYYAMLKKTQDVIRETVFLIITSVQMECLVYYHQCLSLRWK